MRLLAPVASSVALTLALMVAAACGDSDGPGGAGGGAAACEVDPPGATITIEVVNTGTRDLLLELGCGERWPITVATPEGALPIRWGGDLVCNGAETCEEVYGGADPVEFCSDCGPGVTADLAPSASRSFAWDRRAYQAITAPPECVSGAADVGCSLGVAVTGDVAGTLTFCESNSASSPPDCAQGTVETRTFAIDGSATSVIVDVD